MSARQRRDHERAFRDPGDARCTGGDEVGGDQPVGGATLAVEVRFDLKFVGKIDGVDGRSLERELGQFLGERQFGDAQLVVNGELIAQLATGAFLDDKRNVVLVGGTGTGKSHSAIGLATNSIKAGRKARFYTSSTSSVISPSRCRVASCCSTLSAGSTSARLSS